MIKLIVNIDNKIIKNIFSGGEINAIHTQSLSSENIVFNESMGQRLYMLNLPEEIKQRVTDIAKIHSGIDSLVLDEASYCVYMSYFFDGKMTTPKLIPHIDENMGGKRITLDVQIVSNTTWPINVSDKEYTLQDNEAILFAGTDQIHGRPHKSFQYKEYLHMLFLHFSYT